MSNHAARLKPFEDAYGRLMLDHFQGRPAVEIVERDDGMIMVNRGPMMYFEPIRRWPQPESAAVRLVRGKVLDIGCGPGRVALHLQTRGFDVVGVDVSPGAIRVARARGLRKARVLALDGIDARLGVFDTVVMFGNNFGLFESRAGAVRRLGRLSRITAPDARILASSRDPYMTDDPIHLAYHRSNRARGRMGGQVRLRVRHRTWATPWFDYLMVSAAEMEQLAAEGGWRLTRTIGDGQQYYVGLLEKRH
jgi:SAM-dependent methyltransferase